MSRNPFTTALRRSVTDALAEPGEHSRADLAQAFLAENPELAAAAITNLAEKQVGELIKALCDAEPDDAQMSFFAGLPAAIAVGPGLVKSIEHCDPDDLAIGEEHRKDNITSARGRLKRYRDGVDAYVKARVDAETVGETAKRLAEREAGTGAA